MENASKALLIAGAILLAILLISLGIMVYNNAKGTISDANIDTETIQAFNSKITQYCGKDQSSVQMDALMDVIASINGAQNGLATPHWVNWDTSNCEGATSKVDVDVKNRAGHNNGIRYATFSKEYRYKATYTTGEGGYITKVTIKNN